MTLARSILADRRAGVLLHPTSLPGATIGAEARRFVDFAAAAGFSVWQVLPLGPVDQTNSPYQLHSAFAGNECLIDLAELEREPWWPAGGEPATSLPQAWSHFRQWASQEDWDAFVDYRRSQASWLVPYALFTVLSSEYPDLGWWDWPPGVRNPRARVLTGLLALRMPAINAVLFGQYLFDRQWRQLRSYAASRGVYLFGDLPFYVDRHSADVWWRRGIFRLDADGQPAVVAGVPPDYFSEEGQWWGYPLYDWAALQAVNFDWWLARLAHQARWFDLVRLDHFRALESCWAIPADAASARDGHWEAVPGADLLDAVRQRLPQLQLVAEDLGTITDAVVRLRDRFKLPGMLVLQFAFDGSPDNPYLPDNHAEHAVVYTGTHDNDTSAGWYASLAPEARAYIDPFLGNPESAQAAALALSRAAYASPARLAVLPLQDLLLLGSEARMNTPGTTSGNWAWKFDWSELTPELAERCRRLADEADRTVSSERQVEQAVV